MQGFKEFLMRGNLIELAVAFVVGAAFATVVEAFTAMFMDILGKLGGTPDFSNFAPGGVKVGAFLTALIAFLIIAAVVYFVIVMPMNKLAELRKRGADEDDIPPTSEELLAEIRDLMAEGRQQQVPDQRIDGDDNPRH